jgi:hypothetical protein
MRYRKARFSSSHLPIWRATAEKNEYRTDFINEILLAVKYRRPIATHLVVTIGNKLEIEKKEFFPKTSFQFCYAWNFIH